MTLYKRGGVYWFNFKFRGQKIQQSTKQGDRKVARQMEAACRTALAKGEVGISERKPAPPLKDFAQRFVDAIQVRCAAKPRTIAYYAEKLQRLLEFESMANARLDAIDEALIESYVQERIKKVAPATVNRQLATLKRLLRLAYEWRVINRVPRIRMLPGEKPREFVLSHAQEQIYLELAPQPLRDVAVLILDTGLRIGEALALEWRDVHVKPANGSKSGYIQIRDGKSKNARRNLSLTPRVEAMLRKRHSDKPTRWVFESSTAEPYLVTSLDHLHEKTRALLGLPKDVALLVLDTGLSVRNAMKLQWEDFHFGPIKGGGSGYIHIHKGGSKNAGHNLLLTPRVETMLRRRFTERQNRLVFENQNKEPRIVTSLDSLREFVLHSLRHTFGTRLGESGADAFTIMRLMGHSSVTVSQRYVHPTPEAMERAFERLEALNAKATQSLTEGQNRALLTTNLTTPQDSKTVSPCARVAQLDRAAVS